MSGRFIGEKRLLPRSAKQTHKNFVEREVKLEASEDRALWHSAEWPERDALGLRIGEKEILAPRQLLLKAISSDFQRGAPLAAAAEASEPKAKGPVGLAAQEKEAD